MVQDWRLDSPKQELARKGLARNFSVGCASLSDREPDKAEQSYGPWMNVSYSKLLVVSDKRTSHPDSEAIRGRTDAAVIHPSDYL